MERTWIVIADSAKAKIYEYQGVNTPLKSIDELSHVNSPTRDLVSSKQGRMADSSSAGQQRAGVTGRSTYDPPTDPREHEKFVFAQEVNDYLKKRSGDVGNLILAAAPRMLGDLRQMMPDSVKSRISAELDKDLINVPEVDLPKHLQSVLNISPKPRPREF